MKPILDAPLTSILKTPSRRGSFIRANVDVFAIGVWYIAQHWQGCLFGRPIQALGIGWGFES